MDTTLIYGVSSSVPLRENRGGTNEKRSLESVGSRGVELKDSTHNARPFQVLGTYGNGRERTGTDETGFECGKV